MKYRDHLEQDRRLVILRVLVESPGYRANDSVIHTALEAYGHSVSRDQARTDIAWLAEQGLISTEEIGDGVTVATLSQRGEDVAAGRAVAPGVKKPAPGA